MRLFLSLILAFLAGSIPFGVIVGKRYGVDVRTLGSKNIGATNVLRTLGLEPALITFLLDLSKGAIPVSLAFAKSASPLFPILVGCAAIAGHMFSPFVGFKGGRGVATGAGVILALTPGTFLIALAIFAAIVFKTRYVSLASMVSAAAIPLMYVIARQSLEYIIFTTIIAAGIIWKHRDNIDRLKAGTENKFGTGVS